MFSSQNSQVAAAATQAEAIDYDGTNDYLSRSSALSGSSASKTFTFSCWMWLGPQTASTYPRMFKIGVDNTTFFEVIWTGYASGTGNIWVQARTGGSLDLNWQITPSQEFNNTWINLLISCDMANTANRSVYINDISQGTGAFSNYNNATLPFNTATQYVAYDPVNVNYYRGRISNLFLDLTYRDMSVTANRRLFVTADLKPAAGQAALNPLVYLTMADPTQPGKNSGTGGDFTLTGTVARSGRGPNQYNAPYSTFDGSADYLSRTTALTGVTASKEFTVSFCFSKNSGIEGTPIELTTTGGYGRFTVYYYNTNLYLYAWDSSNAVIIEASISMSLVTGRNYVVTISCDTTSTSKRHVYINGQAATVSWSSYVNNTIPFNTASPTWRLGVTVFNNTWLNGKMGAFYLSTSYIDLSQPANLAKFVTGTGINAAPADLGATGELPTGTSPLIYLPMYGNNAGKNYGTGGDFTVNSGPYAGARGPNEFWGNKADFNGTTGYLSRGALSVSDSGTISGSFFVSFDTISSTEDELLVIRSSALDTKLELKRNYNSSYISLAAYNAAGTQLLNCRTATGSIAINTTYQICFCIDLSNTAKRFFYINGVLDSSSWSTYTNGTIDLTSDNTWIGQNNGGGFLNGKLSEFYFTNEYIDFSQETNRLKFRDCFGNPTDLPSAITAQSVPNPAIYMRFDPASFGTNSGTGGNFTVNGTITDGGQL